jgi:hypothetical protein
MEMRWWRQMRDDLGTLVPVGVSFGILALSAFVFWALTWSLPWARPLETGLLLGVIVGPVVGPIVSRWEKLEERVEAQQQSLYLEGKMRRYSLLFSVNGGAFAIAKLLREPKPPGDLSMPALALGAIVFTMIMTADIWLWGAGMRNEHGARLFRPVGQSILLMIGALLCAGWVLVGQRGG